jgi:histone H3/H4
MQIFAPVGSELWYLSACRSLPGLKKPDYHSICLSRKERLMSEKETLVVASKVKNYIRSQSEMNTSANVMDALSDKIRSMCDTAIENARKDGRKTVKDRDFT